MKAMYKSTFLFLFFLMTVGLAENSNSRLNETPLIEQVIANDQCVYLLIGESWLVADSFQVSENGMFVLVNGEWVLLSEAAESGDYRIKSWKCSRCGRYNLEGINACVFCGKPKNA